MKNEVSRLTQILSIAQNTLSLLKQKRNIIDGQKDGELTDRQNIIEQQLLSEIDLKILALDSKFVNLYEQIFEFNLATTLSAEDKELIIKLQSVIPEIEKFRK